MKTPAKAKLDPRYAEIPPGEILATEFLEPLGITSYRLAKDTGMPRSRVSDILKGKRSITAETALGVFPLFRELRELLAQSPKPLRSRKSHPRQSGENQGPGETATGGVIRQGAGWYAHAPLSRSGHGGRSAGERRMNRRDGCRTGYTAAHQDLGKCSRKGDIRSPRP